MSVRGNWHGVGWCVNGLSVVIGGVFSLLLLGPSALLNFLVLLLWMTAGLGLLTWSCFGRKSPN
ncbi:hypothetical protein IWZ00DRAFT_515749 [Phyllosticta capitalensis]